MSQSIIELLACPQCKGSLNLQSNQCSCKDCQQSYPTLDSIPWLVSNPKASLGEWKEQFKLLLFTLDREVEDIKNDLKLPDLMASTLKRLRKQLQAKVEQRKLLTELLSPLNISETGNYEVSTAMEVKLPRSQSLLSYFGNIHRDWSWDDVENKEGLSCIKDLVMDSSNLGKLLVAGSGSSRLLYDVAESFRPSLTVGIDINPLMFLAAKKILKGKTVRLYEFPIAPKNIESFSALRKCEAPDRSSSPIELIFADAMNFPFRPSSFDTVLTPWIIDIIPEPPDTFFPKINQVLKNGGYWLNFGSLVYDYKNPAKDYSHEEVLEIAQKSGFEIIKHFCRKIPYLQSPISNHGRVEGVFCFSAKKVRNLEQMITPFKTIPAWISDSSKSIPNLPEYETLRNIYKVHLEVLTNIDDRTSINQIAKLFSEKYHLTFEEAHDSIVKYLGKTFQEFKPGR
jgi:uncharacterized protein YbaR (Trm112 family)/ubiquinone/menaquinone biosynthesis C-methylase UbiE